MTPVILDLVLSFVNLALLFLFHGPANFILGLPAAVFCLYMAWWQYSLYMDRKKPWQERQLTYNHKLEIHHNPSGREALIQYLDLWKYPGFALKALANIHVRLLYWVDMRRVHLPVPFRRIFYKEAK